MNKINKWAPLLLVATVLTGALLAMPTTAATTVTTVVPIEGYSATLFKDDDNELPHGPFVHFAREGVQLVAHNDGVTKTQFVSEVVTFVGVNLNETSAAGGGSFISTTLEAFGWGDHWGWNYPTGPNFMIRFPVGKWNLQTVQGLPTDSVNDRITKWVYFMLRGCEGVLPNGLVRIYNHDKNGGADETGGFVDVRVQNGQPIVYQDGITVTQAEIVTKTFIVADLEGTNVAGGVSFYSSTSQSMLFMDHWSFGFATGPDMFVEFDEVGAYSIQTVQGFPKDTFNDKVKKLYVPARCIVSEPEPTVQPTLPPFTVTAEPGPTMTPVTQTVVNVGDRDAANKLTLQYNRNQPISITVTNVGGAIVLKPWGDPFVLDADWFCFDPKADVINVATPFVYVTPNKLVCRVLNLNDRVYMPVIMAPKIDIPFQR